VIHQLHECLLDNNDYVGIAQLRAPASGVMAQMSDIENGARPMKMTRRQVVIAATSLGLTSAIMQLRPTAALANVPAVTPTTTGPETELLGEASFFSSNFAHRTVATVPLAVPLTSSKPVSAGSLVRMTYDPRLYGVSERAIVALLGSTAPSSVTVLPRSASVSELSFALPYRISADPSIVTLPLSTPTLYPNDSLDDVTPVSLTVTDPTGSEIFAESWPVRTDKDVIDPWGVELTGAWDSFTVRHRQATKNYRWPFLVKCISVGPGAIPAGSRIEVSLDPHLVSRVVVTNAMLNDSSVDAAAFAGSFIRQRDEMILPIVLGGGLPAGAQLAFQLSVTPASGRRQITAVRNATATFIGPSTDAIATQRATAKTTLSDATNSGSPLTPDSAVNIG
jgi:hypothetical protein